MCKDVIKLKRWLLSNRFVFHKTVFIQDSEIMAFKIIIFIERMITLVINQIFSLKLSDILIACCKFITIW